VSGILLFLTIYYAAVTVAVLLPTEFFLAACRRDGLWPPERCAPTILARYGDRHASWFQRALDNYDSLPGRLLSTAYRPLAASQMAYDVLTHRLAAGRGAVRARAWLVVVCGWLAAMGGAAPLLVLAFASGR
jgi:hypothetical protein